MTLIALTAQNRRSISPHAGMCRNFLVFEVDGTQIGAPRLFELEREQSFHELQDGQPHPLDGVEVVISGGMGDGLRQKLARRGIQAFVTSETEPLRAVELFIRGELPTPAPAAAGDHTHGHGCGQCACGH